MAMLPGLQLNIGQQLKLTPQLQQSIKILQYSAMEVQQTINTALETNFMLELDDDFSSADELDDFDDSPEKTEDSEMSFEDEKGIETDMKADMEWEEVYTDYKAPVSNDEFTSADVYTSAHISLHEHLQWQLDIAPYSDLEHLVASFIIDDINEEGFLTSDLETLFEYINNECQELDFSDEELSLELVERILVDIQQFEPTGVAARDLQESLSLQLNAMKATPYVMTARQLISENFDWLTYHDHKRIMKMYGLNDEELTTLLKLIQSLNPRPGREFANSESDVIVPDLRLKRLQNEFVVELNPNAFPRLSVNQMYVSLAENIKNTEESRKVKEQLAEAKGLIKSIHSRGETLLRVGQFIVERQKEFFEQGETAMQTLVLREVAEHLELHESTISRATNQKYMQTPRGTFELKYFFSTGVSQYGASDQSSTAIKAHIKSLIDDEDPKKPLSDSKLMDLLEEKEISVARRTIAKYREAMNIPSSSERKKLNKYKL